MEKNVSFFITTNGKPIDDTIKVASIFTTTGFNQAQTAKITILENAGEDLPVSSSNTFIPGNAISIALGYDGTDTEVFEGTITAQNIQMDSTSNGVLLEIHCGTTEYTIKRHSASEQVIVLSYGKNILELNATLTFQNKLTSGEAGLEGDASIQPGQSVQLEGFGSRFNGLYPITGISHQVAHANWLSKITFGEKNNAVDTLTDT